MQDVTILATVAEMVLIDKSQSLQCFVQYLIFNDMIESEFQKLFSPFALFGLQRLKHVSCLAISNVNILPPFFKQIRVRFKIFCTCVSLLEGDKLIGMLCVYMFW